MGLSRRVRRSTPEILSISTKLRGSVIVEWRGKRKPTKEEVERVAMRLLGGLMGLVGGKPAERPLTAHADSETH